MQAYVLSYVLSFAEDMSCNKYMTKTDVKTLNYQLYFTLEGCVNEENKVKCTCLSKTKYWGSCLCHLSLAANVQKSAELFTSVNIQLCMVGTKHVINNF